MPDGLLALVYPGCYVRITDTDAFVRNPLRQNALIELKDEIAHPELFFADAHVSEAGSVEERLVNVCVRCHPYSYGPLCEAHRAEVAP